MHITLFVDADNISYYNYGKIIELINKENDTPIINVKIFGNFSTKSLNRWKRFVKDSSISFIDIPIIKKKNITDHVMIVEAMKDLYTSKMDVFALASDDVDFFPLYTAIRQEGKKIWQISQNVDSTRYLDDFVDLRIDVSKVNEDIELIPDEDLSKMIDTAFNSKKIDDVALLGDVKYWLDTNVEGFSMDKTPFKKFSKLIVYLDEYIIIQEESEFKMKKKPC